MQLVVSGLQDVQAPLAVGHHVFAREPDECHKEQCANQVANIDIQPVGAQLAPADAAAGLGNDNQHGGGEQVGARNHHQH
ncbi:hypothetical protein D3C78_1753260 [compost metagenome]